MDQKIYDQEINICREQFKNKGGCNWGRCSDCGVIPLLYKLHKGELVEGKKDVEKLRNNLLNN